MTASAHGLFRATGKKSKPVAVRVGDDLAGAPLRTQAERDRWAAMQ